MGLRLAARVVVSASLQQQNTPKIKDKKHVEGDANSGFLFSESESGMSPQKIIPRKKSTSGSAPTGSLKAGKATKAIKTRTSNTKNINNPAIKDHKKPDSPLPLIGLRARAIEIENKLQKKNASKNPKKKISHL